MPSDMGLPRYYYITGFARCSTFCKTWFILSRLNAQANKTNHWEIYHSRLCQIETLLLKPNNPLSKSHSDDKVIHTCRPIIMNTLSNQWQHTLLYIKHCSLSCSLFLFTSTKGTLSPQPKNRILNTVHLIAVPTLHCCKFSLSKK